MKKVLSLVLVLALVLGSFGMAFADTTNSVSKVPTVADDEIIPVVALTLKVKDPNGWDTTAQKIRLSLKNAEWNEKVNQSAVSADIATNVAINLGDASSTSTHAIGVVVAPKGGTAVATGTAVTVHSIGDNYIEFSFEPSGTILEDGNVTVTLNLKSGDDAGEVKVEIDGLDSQVSSGTYTVAVVGTDNTVTKVTDDPKKTGRATDVKATNIEIRETAVNSVNVTDQAIKLSLPKGVSWHTKMNTNAGDYIKGDMLNGAPTAVISGDERDLTITFEANNTRDVREVLTITPQINVGKDAKLGDIAVQIRNQKSSDGRIDDESGLVVAVYREEGVEITTVKEADLPEIIAGRMYKDFDNDRYEVEVTVEEMQDDSFIPGKYIDFTFPDYVQIVSGEAIKVETDITNFSDALAADNCDPKKGTLDDEDNSFEWEVPTQADDNKANEVTFTIPVTVEANAKAGDLELTVSGAKAGVEETKIVVGKIIAPVSVEVKLSDIRTGVQDQAVGDIIIKENVVGALGDEKDNKTLVLWVDDNNQNIGFGEAYAEVTAGDLELKYDNKKDVSGDDKSGTNNTGRTKAIVIPVERSSIKTLGEIKISGVKITLDRTPAEGKYAVRVGGSALVDNTAHRDDDFASAAVKTDYINVVTPADQGVNSTFVIGSKTYTVNGAERTMDAAAYIDAAGRTMLPIRFVADALNVSENQIVWDQPTQTATIFGKNTVVIKMGSNILTVNGSPVPMDTVAVNDNGYIYVPARFVANALGASVAWDQATKTATIYTLGK